MTKPNMHTLNFYQWASPTMQGIGKIEACHSKHTLYGHHFPSCINDQFIHEMVEQEANYLGYSPHFTYTVPLHLIKTKTRPHHFRGLFVPHFPFIYLYKLIFVLSKSPSKPNMQGLIVHSWVTYTIQSVWKYQRSILCTFCIASNF